MLDPWIIEEIRRREEDQRRREQRPPVLEMPVHGPRPEEREQGKQEDDSAKDRGVTVIDLMGV